MSFATTSFRSAAGHAADQIWRHGDDRPRHSSDGLLGAGPLSHHDARERDIAAFETPNLRNVLVTGPYFHDGSQETLSDVMDHYSKGDGHEFR